VNCGITGGVFAALGATGAVRRASKAAAPGCSLDLSMHEALTTMRAANGCIRSAEGSAGEPHPRGPSIVNGQGRLRRDHLGPASSGRIVGWTGARSWRRSKQLRFQIGRWAYRDLIRETYRSWMAERTVRREIVSGTACSAAIAALGNGRHDRDMDYATSGWVRCRIPRASTNRVRRGDVAVRAAADCAVPRPSARPTTSCPGGKANPKTRRPTRA